MTPPPGLSLPSPQHVCKLQRSLYGLRQAGHQWYAKLSTFLLSNNYSISIADHSLFLKYNNDKLTVILVYVDDLLLTGDDTEEINTITASVACLTMHLWPLLSTCGHSYDSHLPSLSRPRLTS